MNVCSQNVHVFIVALMQQCYNSDFAILSYVYKIVTKIRTHWTESKIWIDL